MTDFNFEEMMMRKGLICKECNSEVRLVVEEGEVSRAGDGLCYYHAKKKAGLFGIDYFEKRRGKK